MPKVNRELWVNSNMKKQTRENDRKFQMTQLYLSKGLVPLVKLTDILLKPIYNETDSSDLESALGDEHLISDRVSEDYNSYLENCLSKKPRTPK